MESVTAHLVDGASKKSGALNSRSKTLKGAQGAIREAGSNQSLEFMPLPSPPCIDR